MPLDQVSHLIEEHPDGIQLLGFPPVDGRLSGPIVTL